MSDYKPVVGELVKLKDCLDGYRPIYGQECIGEELRIMAIFMDGVVDVCVVKFNNVNYCFRADLLEQIRTQEEVERDKAILEMAELMHDKNPRCDLFDKKLLIAFYDAGYRLVGEKVDFNTVTAGMNSGRRVDTNYDIFRKVMK